MEAAYSDCRARVNLDAVMATARDVKRQSALDFSQVLYELDDPREMAQAIERREQREKDISMMLSIIQFLTAGAPLAACQLSVLMKYGLF